MNKIPAALHQHPEPLGTGTLYNDDGTVLGEVAVYGSAWVCDCSRFDNGINTTEVSE